VAAVTRSPLRVLDAGADLERALDAHSAALDGCRRCESADPAALPVLSGARRPRAMLVGQAPGKTEIVDRKPFAGRAGKTLFRWLERAGIDEATARERIYIAAITRCYPGPSPSGRGDRVPSPRERGLCASWLEDELTIIRPPLLIPVGRLAIDRFLGPLPLERLVGRTHRVAHPGGESLVIPLPHPSGASSWVHEHDHRALLDRALVLLGEALSDVGVRPAPDGRRSVA
jgi:uracil-DNA glycosylase family 4